MNDWPGKARALLLPDICLLCDRPAGTVPNLCRACEESLPRLSTGRMLPGALARGSPAIIAHFAYAPPISTLIHWMKFEANLAAALTLGTLLVESLADSDGMLPEAILPVPLHRARLRERGFNQALELARPVAGAMCRPLALGLCHRTRATPAQSGLGSAAVRRRNVAGAFRVRRDINGPQRLVVVDDVVTTGATVTELTMSLRAAGVTEVVVWACARVI